MTYAILSDQHAHRWSTFSSIGEDGVNTRLRIILDEMKRAADELIELKGDLMVFAGDLFHVRGSIDPEVFNPVHATIKEILERGIKIIAIPGNHDLKGKETDELGNAIQTLGALPGFTVVTNPALVRGKVFVPWISNPADLLAKLRSISDPGSENRDLIIHAGIDGVLPGLPDHGLTAADLASLGFRRVFAGHYHNHKVMEGGKVISIGATTQQTWGDIGTKAGFLLVDGETVTFRASRAPNFVEITPEIDEDEVPLIVDGNYVRVSGFTMTDSQMAEKREALHEAGAIGVVFQVTRETPAPRSGATAKSATLEESIGIYVKGLGLAAEMQSKVDRRWSDVLSRVRAD